MVLVYEVYGAGDDVFNGNYFYSGMYGGKPFYHNTGGAYTTYLYWNVSIGRWFLTDIFPFDEELGQNGYYSQTTNDLPANYWTMDLGLSPAPWVAVGYTLQPCWQVVGAGDASYNGEYSLQLGLHDGAPYYKVTGEERYLYLTDINFAWQLADVLGDEFDSAYDGSSSVLPANSWGVTPGKGTPPAPTLYPCWYPFYSPPWWSSITFNYSYVANKYTASSDEAWSTIATELNVTEDINSAHAQCAVYKVSDDSLVETTEVKEITNTVELWYYFDFDNELNLSNGEEYYLVVQLWEFNMGSSPTYRIGAEFGVGYVLTTSIGGGYSAGYWPDPVSLPNGFSPTEYEYAIELSTTKNTNYDLDIYLTKKDEGKISYNADIDIGVHDIFYSGDICIAETYNISYNSDVNIGVHDISYNSDVSLQAIKNVSYSGDVIIQEIKDVRDIFYYSEVDLKKMENILYASDIRLAEVFDVNCYGDVYLTKKDEEKISYSDIAIDTVQGLIQNIKLFPCEAHYITRDGINEEFNNSKELSSYSYIYINHSKIGIPDSHLIKSAKLKLYIGYIVGASTSINLNVYAANSKADYYTGWKSLISSGSLRGSMVGTLNILMDDRQKYVEINIDKYVYDYIYGDRGYYGLILEASSNDETGKIEIMGLNSWDDNMGEYQNPIIDIEYSYDATSFIDSQKISAVVTQDSYNKNSIPDNNYGNESLIRAFEYNDGDAENALFKLDMSHIPYGSDILRAKVYFPRSVVSAQEGQTGFFYKILQDWDEASNTWYDADSSNVWQYFGGHYDDTTFSYGMDVGARQIEYDVTDIMQNVMGSFNQSKNIHFYGILIKHKNLQIVSKDNETSAYLEIKYMADKLNQPPEKVTLNSPVIGSSETSQPTFEATINNDNIFGLSENNDLDFRLEISSDISFSSDSIDSYSTTSSTTGWHWSAIGDFSDDSTTFPIVAGTYTAGVSRVRFVMSETSNLLSSRTWAWRIITIDS